MGQLECPPGGLGEVRWWGLGAGRGRAAVVSFLVSVKTVAVCAAGGSTVCGAERGKAVTVYKWWVVRASVSAYFPGPGGVFEPCRVALVAFVFTWEWM
ncbi:hypothetical protein E2C01_005392 [Portunus trituberculatus]|uniref:Uncharacterized protein n=1 Tax=Portunus trituberculatus TaxID=210409 RepID=A0A5B7CWJ3_PORTR|nr:hypothetical protein [Portunus trituberculatus]